ncbi:unnamed protein product [Owenia fusiformis]|uniref:Uncharacterized protein n=1 Tax=Owenia fusiformis TaxID=6347 RepID=A0A8J1XTY6_OWEFU|nr:unnamed protein product [Owenia fusiformis]
MKDLEDVQEKTQNGRTIAIRFPRMGKYEFVTPGKYESLLYLVVCTGSCFFGVWHMLSIVFIGNEPFHYCKIPPNSTINDTIPWQYKNDKWSLNQCERFNGTDRNTTLPCTEGWHYDPEPGNTIVTEWDLVCKDNYLAETSQAVFNVGVMVGAVVFTYLSDRYGRKFSFILAELIMVVVGVLLALCTNYYAFTVIRFLQGACQQGIILPGFILACELFVSRQRTTAGIGVQLLWALGMMLMAVFAYFIRDWHYLQLAFSLPGLLCISFIWVVPESIPWLVANDRITEAEAILHHAAEFNGTELPVRPLHTHDAQEEQLLHSEQEKTEKKSIAQRCRSGLRQTGSSIRDCFRCKKHSEEGVEEVKRYTIVDVFRHPKLRMYCLIMCYLWLVSSLVYYGLSLSTSALAGNMYLNFFISGAVEVPAYILCIILLQTFGRRWPLCIFLCTCGVALIACAFTPDKVNGYDLGWLLILLTMIGKFGITGSFGTVFLYAPELYPTNIRNSGMGVASVAARIGGILAPYSAYVMKFLPWFPPTLFGVMSIVAGLLTLLLPETLNRPLPQSIEEVENWKRTVNV